MNFFIAFNTTTAVDSFETHDRSFDILLSALDFVSIIVGDFLMDNYPGHTILVTNAAGQVIVTLDFETLRTTLGR